MQPTVVIPTFWTRRRTRGALRSRLHYDHPTQIGEQGTLPECLRSLENVTGIDRVVLLVAATEESIANAAEDQVREIADDFPGLDIVVVGPAAIGSIHRRMEQLEFADVIGGVGTAGYGAVRNLGLAIAAVFGSETIVFVDDDQIITDPLFLARALEGVGETVDTEHPVLAKTGYYVDESGSYTIPGREHWSETFWRQNELYNRAMANALKGPRIKPATLASGGCLTLHRDMYCNVPFDPWVVRGEDVDYVINARMHGGDVFLDSEWSVIHRPPAAPSQALRFKHDVFRFVYEHRKLEFSESQVDLRQVTAESLMPYPGHLVDSSVTWRARTTAFLRGLSGNERGAYLRVARQAVGEAQKYARDNCESYFAFQRRWPMLMDRLWEDIALQPLLTGELHVDRGALTGRFPVIKVD